MTANELRLGNLVEYSTMIGIIKSINDNGIITGTFINGRDLHVSHLKPIPLTADWLRRFGFNEHHEIGWNILVEHLHKRICVANDKENEIRIVMEYYNGVMTIAKDIKYVHQLQNLYFALSGTELKLKE